MADALHRAIRDAFRDARGYAEKGIVPVLALEATTPLEAHDTLLYRSVYTIFRALPDRLARGTTVAVGTTDVPGGVRMLWEWKEAVPRADEGGLHDVLGSGPHGDLVELAMRALEDFCNVRAGHVRTFREASGPSSSFDRPALVVRRVDAFVPVASSSKRRGSAAA